MSENKIVKLLDDMMNLLKFSGFKVLHRRSKRNVPHLVVKTGVRRFASVVYFRTTDSWCVFSPYPSNGVRQEVAKTSDSEEIPAILTNLEG